MATLTVQSVSSAGVVPASLVAAAAGGDQFTNNGQTFLDVVNGAGAPITVTIASQRACDQGATHNTTVTVTNGTTKRIGPFPTGRYNDASGYVQVTYSSETTITVGAVSLA